MVCYVYAHLVATTNKTQHALGETTIELSQVRVLIMLLSLSSPAYQSYLPEG